MDLFTLQSVEICNDYDRYSLFVCDEEDGSECHELFINDWNKNGVLDKDDEIDIQYRSDMGPYWPGDGSELTKLEREEIKKIMVSFNHNLIYQVNLNEMRSQISSKSWKLKKSTRPIYLEDEKKWQETISERSASFKPKKFPSGKVKLTATDYNNDKTTDELCMFFTNIEPGYPNLDDTFLLIISSTKNDTFQEIRYQSPVESIKEYLSGFSKTPSIVDSISNWVFNSSDE